MTQSLNNLDQIFSDQNIVSPSDLRALGMDEVGYVKKYRMNGKTAYVLHAANGTAIAVQKNQNDVQGMATQQDLDLVAVH